MSTPDVSARDRDALSLAEVLLNILDGDEDLAHAVIDVVVARRECEER